MSVRGRKSAWAAVGVGVIVTGWLGWSARMARQGAEAELAGLRGQRAAWEAAVHRAQARVAAAEGGLAASTKGHEVGTAGKVAGGGAKPGELRTMGDVISGTPKAEVLMMRWQREVVLLEYGPFFRARGITPEQIAQFQENWMRRAEQRADLRAVGKAQGDEAKLAVARLLRKSTEDYEDAQRATLGAEGYAQWKEFERTLPVRNVVVLGLGGLTALEGVPLSGQQGEQLIQAALAAAGDAATGEPFRLLQAIDWNVLDAQAQRILSSEQFALYRTVATPSSFGSRWKFELEAAARRAQQEEAAALSRSEAPAPGGGK